MTLSPSRPAQIALLGTSYAWHSRNQLICLIAVNVFFAAIHSAAIHDAAGSRFRFPMQLFMDILNPDFRKPYSSWTTHVYRKTNEEWRGLKPSELCIVRVGLGWTSWVVGIRGFETNAIFYGMGIKTCSGMRNAVRLLITWRSFCCCFTMK